jgi:hypothetical protein
MLVDPKSLSAFYAVGGIEGLEKGLRGDRRSGLSSDEAFLYGTISIEEVKGTRPASRNTRLQACQLILSDQMNRLEIGEGSLERTGCRRRPPPPKPLAACMGSVQ